MFKFRTNQGSDSIVKIEVVHETRTAVVIKVGESEYRVAKSSGYYCYHDTWEAARIHQVNKAMDDVLIARKRLDQAVSRVTELESMINPES